MSNEDIIREIDNLYADNLRDKINGTELYEKLKPLIQSFRSSIERETVGKCKAAIQKAGGLYFLQEKLDQLLQKEQA